MPPRGGEKGCGRESVPAVTRSRLAVAPPLPPSSPLPRQQRDRGPIHDHHPPRPRPRAQRGARGERARRPARRERRHGLHDRGRCHRNVYRGGRDEAQRLGGVHGAGGGGADEAREKRGGEKTRQQRTRVAVTATMSPGFVDGVGVAGEGEEGRDVGGGERARRRERLSEGSRGAPASARAASSSPDPSVRPRPGRGRPAAPPLTRSPDGQPSRLARGRRGFSRARERRAAPGASARAEGGPHWEWGRRGRCRAPHSPFPHLPPPHHLACFASPFAASPPW